MGEHYEWLVDPSAAKRRLDHFLVEAGVLGSRSQIHRMISQGLVRLDGSETKAGALLRVGQRIDAEKPATRARTATAEEIPLTVLYEDPYLLVVDKPAGLVVHPAPGHWSGTLVHALLHRWGGEQPTADPERCGIVHRLDKDTSGVLLVAKDVATHEQLAAMFRRREVRKQYTALVCGVVREDSGDIAGPIGRHRTDRKKMSIREGGRESHTRFEVAERYRGASLVKLFPLTGRTHQLRVHLASIGHPVLSDPVYARGHHGPHSVITRQALHAERLRLLHPRSGEVLRLRSPWPADLKSAVERLREIA